MQTQPTKASRMPQQLVHASTVPEACTRMMFVPGNATHPTRIGKSLACVVTTLGAELLRGCVAYVINLEREVPHGRRRVVVAITLDCSTVACYTVSTACFGMQASDFLCIG